MIWLSDMIYYNYIYAVYVQIVSVKKEQMRAVLRVSILEILMITTLIQPKLIIVHVKRIHKAVNS